MTSRQNPVRLSWSYLWWGTVAFFLHQWSISMRPGQFCSRSPGSSYYKEDKFCSRLCEVRLQYKIHTRPCYLFKFKMHFWSLELQARKELSSKTTCPDFKQRLGPQKLKIRLTCICFSAILRRCRLQDMLNIITTSKSLGFASLNKPSVMRTQTFISESFGISAE